MNPVRRNRQSSKNLVWIDLEMSGLDVGKEVILEVAALITDGDLNILEEGLCLAVRQGNSILEKMDEWNTKHHTASGLVDRVKESKITVAEAERQTLALIKKYCPKNKSPLCGNSVGQDRKFIDKYMPELAEYLHYRNIDVTSIKELVTRWYPDGPKPPKKSDAHQALIDIHESVEELIFYREHYFIPEQISAPATPSAL